MMRAGGVLAVMALVCWAKGAAAQVDTRELDGSGGQAVSDAPDPEDPLVEDPDAFAEPAPGFAQGFMLAVQACWVIDVGSDAAETILTLGFDMERNGRVVPSSFELLEAQGGSPEGMEAAYQAARRAVLRCQGAGGYDLPPDRHDLWKRVEMTFDPRSLTLE